MNLFVKMPILLVETVTVSNKPNSVTEKRIVMMGPMKTHVISTAIQIVLLHAIVLFASFQTAFARKMEPKFLGDSAKLVQLALNVKTYLK
jgi:uncharacterized protein YejL (UPF0352 family)